MPIQPNDGENRPAHAPEPDPPAGAAHGIAEGKFLLNLLSPKSRKALANLADLEHDATLRAFLSSTNSPTRMTALGFPDEKMVRLSSLISIPVIDRYPVIPEDILDRLVKDPPLALLVHVGDNAAETHRVMNELRADSNGTPLSILAFVDSSEVAMRELPHSWADAVIPLDLSEEVLRVHLERLFDILLTKKDLATVFLAHGVSRVQFQKAAFSDLLTGLMNFAGFQDVTSRELSRLRRWRQPLSMIMFDIDHFKKINDTFGHPAGDDVLRQMGLIVQARFAISTLCSGWGERSSGSSFPTRVMTALVSWPSASGWPSREPIFTECPPRERSR